MRLLPTAEYLLRRKIGFGLFASLCFVSLADAGWEKPADPQSRAEIVFVEDGKWVVDLACSLNLALFLKYPGTKQSGPANLLLSNSDKHVLLRGGFTKDNKDTSTDARDPPFVAAWGKNPPYPADLDAVESILFSGKQLSFTAEGRKYVLPGMDKNAATRFKNDC
jgi:hypothetical protein